MASLPDKVVIPIQLLLHSSPPFFTKDCAVSKGLFLTRLHQLLLTKRFVLVTFLFYLFTYLFVNLTSVEKTPPSGWPIGKFMVSLLDCSWMWCGSTQSTVSGGCRSWPRRGKWGSWNIQSLSETLIQFLTPASCLAFPHWWTVKCMLKYTLPSQTACGHGVHHSNGKHTRTQFLRHSGVFPHMTTGLRNSFVSLCQVENVDLYFVYYEHPLWTK